MKKDDIISAALKEFGRYEYDRASINSIIENSNTSKGTFYHYFKNKESLYLELIKKVSQEKINFLQDNINERISITDDSSIFKVLEAQIELSMKFAIAYPEYALYSSKVANETNNNIKEKIKAIVGSTTNEMFEKLIKMSISHKKIRDDLPEQFITQLLLYMITQFNDLIINLGIKIIPDNISQIMEYMSYYIDFLENGLKYKNI